jgi:hypothetical protein
MQQGGVVAEDVGLIKAVWEEWELKLYQETLQL